jgi:hypothetical protein
LIVALLCGEALGPVAAGTPASAADPAAAAEQASGLADWYGIRTEASGATGVSAGAAKAQIRLSSVLVVVRPADAAAIRGRGEVELVVSGVLSTSATTALVGPEVRAAPGPPAQLPAAAPAQGMGLELAGPSPFREGTTLRVVVADHPLTHIELRIHDAQGRLVRELADGVFPVGQSPVYWDARDGSGRGVASGVYFARLEAGELREVRKLVRVR